MSQTRSKRSRPTEVLVSEIEEVGPTKPLLPMVVLLFVGSGCAALIYEIVWFQLLTLNVGSSAISLGVVLGTFMGGMCLGSLLLPRFISRTQHPLRVYALLEAGIGVWACDPVRCCLTSAASTRRSAATACSGLLLRGIVCAICPAAAHAADGRNAAGDRALGRSDAARRLLARLLLRRQHRRRRARLPARRLLPAARARHAIATLVAVALNLVVAAAGLLAGESDAAYEPAERTVNRRCRRSHATRGWRPVYVAIALSGMTALGAEVVWTRLLSLLLGATTYTFSLILAVFLVGLGIGSSIGSVLARSVVEPARCARLSASCW